MNIDDVVATLRAEQRSLVWPGDVVRQLPLVTWRSWVNGEQNEVTAHSLHEGNADRTIQEQIAHFRGLGRSFEWKAFSFDAPPDLVERLRVAGFAVGKKEAIVVYDLHDGLAPFEEDFDCEVQRIERLEQLTDFRQVAEAVFAKDYSPTTNQLAEALQAGQTGHDAYIAYVNGVPAAIGRLYTNPQSAFGGLYGGATRVEFRKRGCYRAIVAARARDAAELGSRYLQVDAMPTSLPILLRLGFLHIADTWPCLWPVDRAEPNVESE